MCVVFLFADALDSIQCCPFEKILSVYYSFSLASKYVSHHPSLLKKCASDYIL
jgi:hypothetical protein